MLQRQTTRYDGKSFFISKQTLGKPDGNNFGFLHCLICKINKMMIIMTRTPITAINAESLVVHSSDDEILHSLVAKENNMIITCYLWVESNERDL